MKESRRKKGGKESLRRSAESCTDREDVIVSLLEDRQTDRESRGERVRGGGE